MSQLAETPSAERPLRVGAFLDPPSTSLVARLLLVLVSLTGASWVAGAVIPYYVNDIDALSTSEVGSGAHDPKEMWPVTAGLAGELLHTLAVLAVLAGPFFCATVAAWAVLNLLGRWSVVPRAMRISYLVTLLLSVATAVAILSSFGQDVTAWLLD